VCLINSARADHGLPPLRANGALTLAAQRWTNAMVAKDTGGNDPRLGRRVAADGFNWSAVGQNAGTGYRTPRQIVRAWMASTPHCQIILDPSFADVGTGVNRHAVTSFARGGATWTADFGLAEGARAPSGNWSPANGCPYEMR
jgi:uncharacterized protein YkwD